MNEELCETPAWSSFIGSLKAENSFIFPRALRRYQSDILDTGTFSIVSPFSGVAIEAGSGFRVTGEFSTHGTQIAYHFDDESEFWLLTGPLDTGHRLSEIILSRTAARRAVLE